MADSAPSNADETLLRSRLAAVQAPDMPMIAMDIFGSTLLAGYFWTPERSTWLVAWLIATLALCIPRIDITLAFHAGKLARMPARGIVWRLLLYSALSSLLWGTLIIWMLAVGNDNETMFAVCIGLGALSLTIANVAYWPIYATFAIPASIAAVIGFILSDRPGHGVLAGAGFALTVAMVAISRHLGNQVLYAHRLAATNQALVDSLAVRSRELEQACDALERVSQTDPLTGLANRRSRDLRLAEEWARALHGGAWLAVVAIDVDGFKRFNDTHGHEQGDRALRAVAEMLEKGIRAPIDLAARHGGEEFMLILPGADLADAASIAERVREMVARCSADAAFSLPEKLTISLGVAAIQPAPGRSMHELTIAADAALYQAKVAGRDRCELADIAAVASAA